jgi:hypothetical protein
MDILCYVRLEESIVIVIYVAFCNSDILVADGSADDVVWSSRFCGTAEVATRRPMGNNKT